MLASLVQGAPLILPVRAATPLTTRHPVPYGEVDWGNRGYIEVSAVGWAPFGQDGVGMADSARKNAVTLARRHLLAALLTLPIPGSPLRIKDGLPRHPEWAPRVRALIGAAAIDTRQLPNGSTEVTLTLRMAGPDGVRHFLDTLSS